MSEDKQTYEIMFNSSKHYNTNQQNPELINDENTQTFHEKRFEFINEFMNTEQQQKWQFKRNNLEKERKDLKGNSNKTKKNAKLNQIREKLKEIQQKTSNV